MTRPGISTTACLLLAVLASGCARPPQSTDDVRPVRTASVRDSAATQHAIYSGQVEARRSHALGFQLSGRIQRRLVEVGDQVTAGQALMLLDGTDSALAATAARAEVDSARSQLAQVQGDYTRYVALSSKGYVGRSEFDKQKLALATAEQSLKAAEANYRVAANQASYATLRASVEGVVTALEGEVGQVVQAGQRVVEVAEHGERELVVSVPESRVEELREAASLAVELWAEPHRRYAARLRELAPDTDDVTRTYAARVTLLAPDAAVRLGMTARLLVTSAPGREHKRLPLTALLESAGQPQVWVVDPVNSRVALRKITVAQVLTDDVLVSDGLEDGERVVTAGVHWLHAGQQVRLVDDASPVGG